MKYFREELFPCVYLTALRTDRFKTGCLSVNLLTQLRRETAAENAVIPYVLRRGTTSLPDMRRISARLEGLYGASIDPVVRKLGEIQAVGFAASFAEDPWLPGETHVLRDVIERMAELWLSPNTRGGLFLPDYVEGERDKLLERLAARQNNRRAWAARRLIENMCSCEDYAVDAQGGPREAESIHYVKLTRRYRGLLPSAPMEIFYCGGEEPGVVADLLREAFALLPRGEIDPDLGTDIRMNAVEDSPRIFTETMDVTQGNLAVGFRLGRCMEDPDSAAIRVFNAVYGGSASSRLFRNVREKMSLCYYAGSSVDELKGILTVNSGIDFDKYEPALEEILRQLKEIGRDGVDADELRAARNDAANSLRSVADSPYALESFYLRQAVQGLDASPEDIAALAETVTADEVTQIARGVELDAVYFLRGEEAE